jgi:polyadenylate-binding protein 2
MVDNRRGGFSNPEGRFPGQNSFNQHASLYDSEQAKLKEEL